MKVMPYKIESESDADGRLDALLADPESRSMDRIRREADIQDETLKKYFLDKARALLSAKPT